MTSIERTDKLGEGAYGIVYQGQLNDGDKTTKVAIKRNYGDPENKGIGCIREMNFLAMFNHPCITKLKNISVGDPFEKKSPMTPLPKRNDMKEESHHFILEYAGKALDDFYPDCNDYYFLKIIICQVLLGIEYIHSKKVLHRDLKPGNILIMKEEDGLPYARICDFGLSCFPSNYRPSTPGAVTSWYRAPEICAEYEDYSFPSDMWSAGCIIYEIISKKPFIKTSKDNSKLVFKDIIATLPDKFETSYLNDYIMNGDIGKFKLGYTEKVRREKKKLEDHFKDVDIKKFNKSGGSFNELLEILKNLLTLEANKRWTATECLDHSFFDIFRPFIKDMRKNYPLSKEDSKKIKIIDCLERRWAVNIAFKLYNLRDDLKWYNDHIIFHAIRLFDEYLEVYYDESKNLRKKANKGIGRLHTEYQVNIYFYTCVYIMYKYFSTLYRIYTWDRIFPRHLALNKNIKMVEDFEKLILEEISNYVIFKPTLIEFLDEDYKSKNDIEKDLDIRKYLINYGDIEMNYEGTMEDLYLQIREGLKNTK